MWWRVAVSVLLFAHIVSSESNVTTSSPCPSKYTVLDPSHTMCLEDSAHSVRRLRVNKKVKSLIVSEHNDLRRNVEPPAASMTALVWDRRLAKAAARWAAQCTTAHDRQTARMLPAYRGVTVGQNIAAGESNFSEAVKSWGQEVSSWSYGAVYNDSFANYFQQVSDKTTLIGCGAAACTSTSGEGLTNYFVCNYATGAVTTESPYETGSRSCEGCPLTCNNKLCECDRMVCSNGGTVDVATCQCQCPRGWRGNRCQLKCQKECLNGGTVDYSTCQCQCPRGWRGKACQFKCRKECLNGGTVDYSTCRCQCPRGWSGKACQLMSAEQTTAVPVETSPEPESTEQTTAAPVETSTEPESTEQTTAAPVETSTEPETTEQTTAAPVKTSTEPESTQQTTTVPVITSTEPESTEQTTAAPMETSPEQESTEQSTAAPMETSTEPQSTQQTTTVPVGTSTAVPARATTLAPGADMPLVCSEKYANQTPTHTMCLTDHPNATEVHLSEEVKQQIVDHHNRLRANVDPPPANMQKMMWDDLLALTARKWAMSCVFGHDINRQEPDYPGVFINQNMGAGHVNFQSLINNWYAEKEEKKYVYGQDYVFGIGHYFQVVYHEANRIGCGQASCPQSIYKVFRVCNYAIGLDASGPPYDDGQPCSQCPGHCDTSGALCDCGAKLCYHGGELDVSTCQCKCREGWKGELCNEVDCPLRDPGWSCQQYYKEDCGKNGFVKDPMYCPILCGVCPEPCKDVKCQNRGMLNLETCQCECEGLFTGSHCEVCPEADDANCVLNGPWYCDNPQWYIYMQTSCPYKCGICTPAPTR